MDKEIWAAFVQAAPVAVAALVGGIGLSTWRKQLREGRQVEHAEKALAAAGEMFPTIRGARSPVYRRSDDAPQTDWSRLTADRLNRAWEAWRHFQNFYALARLYTQPAETQLDVAQEVASCIDTLEGAASLMQAYDRGSPEYVERWNEFYGSRNPLEPDPIENELRNAEQALQTELGPVLVPTLPRRLMGAQTNMDTIHNARIQLLATALNNLGVGAIIAGVVAPTVNGSVGGLAHVGAWLAFGADLIVLAQLWLGRLR